MKCETCKYFESLGDGNSAYCHRFPPQNDGQNTKTIDEFPFIRKSFWCGEYKKGTKK